MDNQIDNIVILFIFLKAFPIFCIRLVFVNYLTKVLINKQVTNWISSYFQKKGLFLSRFLKIYAFQKSADAILIFHKFMCFYIKYMCPSIKFTFPKKVNLFRRFAHDSCAAENSCSKSFRPPFLSPPPFVRPPLPKEAR